MAPTLKQSANTSALGVDGNTPTCSIAGDNYEGLTNKALKKLCSERGLAVRGDKFALVGRLRAGKKAGPKSSKEQMAKSRASRSQAKVVADRARDAKYKRRSRSKPENRQAERERNAERMAKKRSNDPQHRIPKSRIASTSLKDETVSTCIASTSFKDKDQSR